MIQLSVVSIITVLSVSAKMDHTSQPTEAATTELSEIASIENKLDSRDRYQKIRKNINDQKNYKTHQRRKIEYASKLLPQKFQSLRKGQMVFVDENLVKLVISGIKKLLDGTRLAPHHGISGKIDGYKILEIQKGCVLYSLGFRKDHVIHQVDKYTVTSMSNVYKAYRRLKKLSPRKIKVVMTVKDLSSVRETLIFFPARKLKE